MAHGLDAIAVGVEQERSVIARVIIGPEAGRPVASPARSEPGSVEGIDGRTARGAEAPVAVVGYDCWTATLPDA